MLQLYLFAVNESTHINAHIQCLSTNTISVAS